jgi:hypothetical protein
LCGLEREVEDFTAKSGEKGVKIEEKYLDLKALR